MSFKAFKKEMPDIYILADNAERAIAFDHVIALNHMKEIGRLLVNKILLNERVKIEYSDPFINLEALMNIEILPTNLEIPLKQLEYFDTRESIVFIDSSQVKKLMFDIYDLTSWYFKTYVNDRFSPTPLLLEPQIATIDPLSNSKSQPTVTKSVIHIDNKIVEGIWEDGNENEYDIEFEANESYQGQLNNGMKSGKGVYRWSDGSKYEGQWYKDSEYGFGVKEYANGDSYHGEWKEGLFHGIGIYKWNDGTRFEGNWKDNLEHGYGVKIFKDGSIQKGFWTLGELVFTEEQLRESRATITKIEDE
ncbi:MORN repeat-containing protein [Paenibacillus tarimensis]